MTIRELHIWYNELKIMLRVELMYGGGSKLKDLCQTIAMLRKTFLSLGVWFEEDEMLFKNLHKFICENQGDNLKLKYKDFGSRSLLVDAIFGKQEREETKEENL